MKKMKILIATDFSNHSDNAVQFASTLLNRMEGDFTFAHISDVSPVWDWPASDQQARNLLSKFQEEILGSINGSMKTQLVKHGINQEGIVRFGNPQEELLKLINETQTDLLILGHRGKTGFFEVGSLAEKMIASSPIPVLVVKDNKEIKRVTCLIDTSKASKTSVDYTQKFTKLLNAEDRYLTFVPDLSSSALLNIPLAIPVYKFNDEEKMQIEDNVKKIIQEQNESISPNQIQVRISESSTVNALSEAMLETGTDLAILSRHNRGPIEKVFIGSTTKGILQNFKGSILVLPH